MKKTPVLASGLLVGIALLLHVLCPTLVAAEVNFPQSLDTVKAFHDHFKDPSSMVSGQGGPSPSLGFANEAGFLRDPALQIGRLVAIDGNKSRYIAYNGLIEPSSNRFNSLDIDVSRITVIAINMGTGGNAVATSDIVLNPVQYLGASIKAEVEEKLR
jgi:hypothetical protein